MYINLNKPVSSFSTKTNNSTITRIDNNLVKNNNNNTDTDSNNNKITEVFRELSKGEVWGFKQQVEMLQKRKKELEEAGIYCVSGSNQIRQEHRAEYRELLDAISILEQKAAGKVNPQPMRQKAARKPQKQQQMLTDAERLQFVQQLADLRKRL
tara:strand:+ start:1366 stop:1827 length:462 start_codon:yes stop_codon:yes gene_type:complete